MNYGVVFILKCVTHTKTSTEKNIYIKNIGFLYKTNRTMIAEIWESKFLA